MESNKWIFCVYLISFLAKRISFPNVFLTNTMPWQSFIKNSVKHFSNFINQFMIMTERACINGLTSHGRSQFDGKLWELFMMTTKRPWIKGTYEDMFDHRSYTLNLSSWEIKAWKNFRPERDSNPWPLRYRCSALPTELSSQLGAGHFESS